jgi:preprotein translocase subunit SecG
MLSVTLNLIYVAVALGIIVMVLMQRGAGAAAGSGFGGGASGTVFGARGASNFLSKSTKWLAIAFFGISLFMAWQASHGARPAVQQNLGLMSEQPAAPAAGERPGSTVPSAPIAPPQAPASTVPQAPAASGGSTVPAAPSATSSPAPQPSGTPPQGE